ncbi:acyltransferase family protein [Marinicaulis aureus]|uniref:Acyltransferase family protein n=1 Tax=Hyphococcus aureus TaxID=2666033 RepID=A0ABW1KWX8_9PROT
MYQGFLRLLLSLIVVVYHFFKTSPMPGPIAVMAFFLVSGFLISRVVVKTYSTSDGLKRFAVNRILRLWPTYLVIIFFSAAVIAIDPAGASRVNAALSWPQSVGGWAAQFFIVGLTLFPMDIYPHRFAPPAFSLAIELFHYALIAVVIRGDAMRTYVWLGVGILIAAYIVIAGLYGAAYYSYFGPTIAFAAGAALHLGYDKWRDKARRWLAGRESLFAAAAVFCFLIYVFAQEIAAVFIIVVLGKASSFAGDILPGANALILYGSIPFACLAFFACMIAPHRSDTAPRRFVSKFSDLSGDLSYPLFLVHWPMLALTAKLAPWWGVYDWRLRVLAIVLSIVFSLAVVYSIEKPMEKIRNRVRRGEPAGQPAASAPRPTPAMAESPQSGA